MSGILGLGGLYTVQVKVRDTNIVGAKNIGTPNSAIFINAISSEMERLQFEEKEFLNLALEAARERGF